jgi:ribonuclease J
MPIRVTHSLVDCVALAIHTPVGVVVHTGDFKIDLSSPDGKPFDLHCLCRAGQAGRAVPAAGLHQRGPPGLYAERARSASPAGRDICADQEEALLQLLLLVDPPHTDCDGTGRAHGRKVAVIGRSLDNSTEIAQDLGYLDLPPGLVINPGQMRDMPVQQSSGDDLGHAGRADVGAVDGRR